MKSIWRRLVLLVLMGGPVWLRAEDFERFEIQSFGGFTGSGSIPLLTEDDVDHGSIRVDSSFNLGGTLAVNLNELDAIEAFWQRQFTQGRLLEETASRSTTPFNLNIDQFRCNFLHHYRIAEPRALPFVMASLGVTRYSAKGSGPSDSESHFSFALGGGVKYFPFSRVGFRGEARWSPTVLSFSDSNVWCTVGGGATCLIDLKTSVQHQVDLTGGLVFRF